MCTALQSITGEFEIVLVEDCGGDNSWAVISELAAADPRIRGIQLSRNFGQHAATICGISSARGEWVATIDDDLEQHPEDLPLLYAKARDGYSLVTGLYLQRRHLWWRNLTSEAARRLFKHAISSLNHAYTSLRIIERNIAKALCNFDMPFPFVDGYLSWLTNNYATVEVEHVARSHGRSNYNFGKLFTL